MSDLDHVSLENRLTYLVRWDIVLKLWKNCEDFRDMVTKSCATVSDKQDPSLVTELIFVYPSFYQVQDYLAVGLYLEVLYLFFLPFTIKTFHPAKGL